MQNDLMALLRAVLSGQGGSQARPAAQMQPMQAQQPMMQPMGGNRISGGPMMASEQHTGFTPGGYPGMDNGGGGNGGKGDGKGGGKGGNNNDRLSKFEMQMRKIANKGPTAYTKPIEKNLGLNKPDFGYGKSDTANFKTGMADSLAGVLTGTEPKIY